MKTTSKILALGLITCLNSIAFGQSLNMSGGVTLSKLRFDGMESGTSTETYQGTTYTTDYQHKSIVGHNVSLGYEFRLSDRLSLETGFRSMSRGYKSTYDRTVRGDNYASNSSETMSYRLNYFDLPVTLNTAITTGDFRTYIRTGIYAGYMSSLKNHYTYDYNDSDGDSYSEEENYTDNDFDIEDRFSGGLTLGVGAEYKGFFFETNYTMGVFLLNEFDSGVSTSDLSFSLGYKLKFKKNK